MKVILINGSRRENGCTNFALGEVARALHEEGIETELFFVGTKAIDGSIDKLVDSVAKAIKAADGIVIGSPVYYASPSGEVLAFLDRLFGVAGGDLTFKPAAAITSARRAGTTASLDVINKYFMINQMPVVSSRYWNMVHGSKPEDIAEDKEGMQIIHTLGKNMAWLIKSIEAGKQSGITRPNFGEKIYTSFIR